MPETPGRRIYPDESGHLYLAECDYGRQGSSWFARPPGCHAGDLSNHEVIEHEDKTITVSPSILITCTNECGERIVWHGYLVRGVWRSD